MLTTMKKHYILLLPIIIFFSASNCNREKNLKCTYDNTVKLPPHALDYFYFKVGTWWVYECEQTGERDSLWVSESELRVGNPLRAKDDCRCAKGLCFQGAYTRILSLKVCLRP